MQRECQHGDLHAGVPERWRIIRRGHHGERARQCALALIDEKALTARSLDCRADLLSGGGVEGLRGQQIADAEQVEVEIDYDALADVKIDLSDLPATP